MHSPSKPVAVVLSANLFVRGLIAAGLSTSFLAKDGDQIDRFNTLHCHDFKDKLSAISVVTTHDERNVHLNN